MLLDRRPLAVFRLAAAVLVAIVTIAAAVAFVSRRPASAGESGVGRPDQVTRLAVEDDRLLYVQHCASCHGDAGQGSNLAPPLTQSGAAALDFYMRTGRMPLARLDVPSWEQGPQLTPEQIQQIVAYAGQFTSGPPIPSVVADTSNLGRGWNLYTNNCAACHGAGGRGGSVGAGVTAPRIAGGDALTIAEAMIVGPGAMPKFQLPDDEVAAIAGYVQFLGNPPTPGGIAGLETGPVPEGFIAGVIGLSLLVLAVRWIAIRDRPRAADLEPPAVGDDRGP